MPKNPRVYFDITIGSRAAGRIVFELFIDITPKTSENFRALCTGELDLAPPKNMRKLHYTGTKLHRIIDGFMI